ncbi:MAG: hypothetical protein ABL985_15050 [Casimicrobium sp.]
MSNESWPTERTAACESLRAKLEEILFRIDPIDLDHGHNIDEYAPEVGTILPRLTAASNEVDVLLIVHEELCRWFDAEDVGPSSAPMYAVIASEMWIAWNDFARAAP